jgi:hypothetical protein
MTFRTLRLRAGFPTQTALAARARRGRRRISQRVISMIECGTVRDPQYSTIVGLAEALGATPDVVAAAIRETPRAARKTGAADAHD